MWGITGAALPPMAGEQMIPAWLSPLPTAPLPIIRRRLRPFLAAAMAAVGLYLSGGSALTVTDSTFTGNQSQNGGAIHLLHSNLFATNVTFTNNTANNTAGGGGGGAIYMDGTKSMAGEVRIIGSQFNGNSTNQLGGAMFTYPEGTGTVTY